MSAYRSAPEGVPYGDSGILILRSTLFKIGPFHFGRIQFGSRVHRVVSCRAFTVLLGVGVPV